MSIVPKSGSIFCVILTIIVAICQFTQLWRFEWIDITKFSAAFKHSVEQLQQNQNKNQTLAKSSDKQPIVNQHTNDTHEFDYNIVYIKVNKVGGSTVGGVMRRIGTKFTLSGTHDPNWINNEPGVWANHGEYKGLRNIISKLEKNTLLITWIREPVERMLSEFYFECVSRGHITPTDDNIIKSLKSNNHQIGYIATNDMSVDDIVKRYYFIGITERFEESMVVLANMLNLNLEDVLYLKAKDSHHLQKDDLGNIFVPSVPLSQQSTKVKEFINKNVKKNNAKDYELWNNVNKQLDLTIGNITNFNEKLKHYHNMLRKADTKCKEQQEHLKYCYWNDNGCGVTCLNSIHDIN